MDIDADVAGSRPVGLVLARPSEVLGDEPYFHELVAGAERVLRPLGRAVLLHVLSTRDEEMACYERWAADGHVAGVLLADLSPGDPRIALVRSLGLPAVAISDPVSGGGLETVWTEDDLAMADAVRYLDDLGHTRIAHVSGPSAMAHTLIRNASFDATAADLGLQRVRIECDYSERSGFEAVMGLTDIDEPPTAIVFDNDLMALGGIRAARERRLAVPGDLSLLAWDDSALCQLALPPLSAMSHDVQGVGALAARSILHAIEGRPPGMVRADRAALVQRASTGPRAAIS
ncbi:DNA-binding LacI/PurR family transcriptional regulator [Agromyces terreus]|uniref:DNA-binding LacI/PurR family transcriptional regulator n=1 Tax=Agromyces terreus TaxID=424795 RepID=A0A9X2KB73_9MICO|nr:substrate-binding domain-containing protein [Agromyces terreus]MCP2370314.1 DNA-binding LacI/PurR family transcriptional regulator [Agromyces terreus]